MRLTTRSRVGLAVLAAIFIAGGAVGSAKNWPGVSLTSFIVIGAILAIAAAVGVFPKVNLKEGGMDWPEVDVHPRIETLESQVSQLTKELAACRIEATQVQNDLVDYILAMEPEP